MSRQRLRVLVLAPKSRYINPFEEELFAELPRHCDVLFYGPGFVPTAEIEPDALKIFDKYGPFDAAILHQYFLLDSLSAASKSCYFPFDVKKFYRQIPKFPLNFSKLPCTQIAQLMRMDYYAVSKPMVEIMNTFDGYFIAWSAQFVSSLQSLTGVDREAWEVPPTDNYHEFARANHKRIIPYMHTVAENLFCLPDAAQKKYPVFVPGQLYALRRDALKQLRTAGYRIANRSKLVGAFSRISSILTGKPIFAQSYGIKYLQENFRRQIQQSLVCFTDGSRLRWPLRKYFEIPALGSLLVCEPFLNAEDLGFLAGKNFVEASPEDLTDIVRKATTDPEWAYAMIDASQKMVRRRHSPSARVSQLIRAIQVILDGDYQGGQWKNGDLVISDAA